jgi:Arc/MetJ-type ribon-helix-helix transcriptional regulator
MSKVEVDLPRRISDEVQRLVDQGEFLNREQAIEELLTRGVSVYNTDTTTDEPEEDVFTQATNDQQDPAAREDTGDEYTF